MRRCRDIFTLIGIAFATLSALTPQMVAAEPFCQAYMPNSPTDAMGFTFIGIVTAVGPERAGGPTWLFFNVEDVLADHGLPNTGNNMVLRPGAPLKLLDQGCDRPYGFAVGERYLYSTSVLNDTHSGKMVAWHVKGDEAHVLIMYPQHLPENAAVFAAADTLEKAVKLIAPGASLPPTSTASAPARSSGPADPFTNTLVLAGCGAAGLLLGRRLRYRSVQ
jgi:hypothetical protein